MSEEKFLKRWSRRKHEAAVKNELRSAPPVERELPREPSAKLPTPTELPPLSTTESLPPIDTIDGSTDVRGFLVDGVPTALSRAALRRAWASDAGIRDFIGLSENAWDFTTPEGVPGFGAVSAEDIRRLLAQADRPPDSRSEAAPDASSEVQKVPPAEATSISADGNGSSAVSEASVVAEPGSTQTEASVPAPRHGGALPK